MIPRTARSISSLTWIDEWRSSGAYGRNPGALIAVNVNRPGVGGASSNAPSAPLRTVVAPPAPTNVSSAPATPSPVAPLMTRPEATPPSRSTGSITARVSPGSSGLGASGGGGRAGIAGDELAALAAAAGASFAAGSLSRPRSQRTSAPIPSRRIRSTSEREVVFFTAVLSMPQAPAPAPGAGAAPKRARAIDQKSDVGWAARGHILGGIGHGSRHRRIVVAVARALARA